MSLYGRRGVKPNDPLHNRRLAADALAHSASVLAHDARTHLKAAERNERAAELYAALPATADRYRARAREHRAEAAKASRPQPRKSAGDMFSGDLFDRLTRYKNSPQRRANLEDLAGRQEAMALAAAQSGRTAEAERLYASAARNRHKARS